MSPSTVHTTDNAGTFRLSERDVAHAHGLARIALGVNIALHGMTRIPGAPAFLARLNEQFAPTFLPLPLVEFAGWAILISESILGVLLILGLFVRASLTAVTMLFIVLLFGTCLSQQFSVATTQMTYLIFIVPLLATAAYDGYSIDRLRRTNARP